MGRWEDLKFLVKREGIDGELRVQVEVEEHIDRVLTLRAVHPVVLKVVE